MALNQKWVKIIFFPMEFVLWVNEWIERWTSLDKLASGDAESRGSSPAGVTVFCFCFFFVFF